MKYSEIRSQIKSGDVLAWSHTGRGSWYDFQIRLVRMATESEFNHVGIAYVIHDRVFVLEAVGQGVRMFPLSRELPFYLVSNPEPLSDEALSWAFSKLGDQYESKLKMVINNFIDLNLNDNKRLQCSEYANGILSVNKQWLTIVDTPSAIVQAAMQTWGSLNYVGAD